ncbi:hypothetical protein B296_00006815 [Ensete ventricosum]|uniref:Uncharacterized protein n=1 Tax=Ensete ventricosum TaxID=4639 RepID=A0A426YYR3_ENSVE|nr:hypothetical protein B296_00006815 [Ensete ventricosum]
MVHPSLTSGTPIAHQWYTHNSPIVHPSLTSDSITGNLGSTPIAHCSPVLPPDNLSVSLDLLPLNSLVSFWQAPDTLNELPTHSKRVPNCIVRTLA